MVEVDDFIVAMAPDYRAELKQLMGDRLVFGKWEADQA